MRNTSKIGIFFTVAISVGLACEQGMHFTVSIGNETRIQSSYGLIDSIIWNSTEPTVGLDNVPLDEFVSAYLRSHKGAPNSKIAMVEAERTDSAQAKIKLDRISTALLKGGFLAIESHSVQNQVYLSKGKVLCLKSPLNRHANECGIWDEIKTYSELLKMADSGKYRCAE